MKPLQSQSVFVAQIVSEGFAVIPHVFDRTEMEALAGELQGASIPRSRAGMRHAMRHPAIADFARHPQLMQLATETFGGGAIPFRATLFDKSPASNWLVVWHQDTALPLREKRDVHGWGPWSIKDGVTYAHAPASALERVLALRVHLDDSTAQNGPLRVLPGTHTLGVLSDHQLLDLSRKIPAVDCTVLRGGIVAMRTLIVHASSKSQSDQPRRVLHIEYSAVSGFSNGLNLDVA